MLMNVGLINVPSGFQDGAVFTFGAGRYGQLGHKSLEDELCPRLVEEPWGAKATKIACGRYCNNRCYDI